MFFVFFMFNYSVNSETSTLNNFAILSNFSSLGLLFPFFQSYNDIIGIFKILATSGIFILFSLNNSSNFMYELFSLFLTKPLLSVKYLTNYGKPL